MNHLGTKILQTERLVLRPFKETDVEDMYHNWDYQENIQQINHTSISGHKIEI